MVIFAREKLKKKQKVIIRCGRLQLLKFCDDIATGKRLHLNFLVNRSISMLLVLSKRLLVIPGSPQRSMKVKSML